MNEMGAIWMKKTDYLTFLLPGFEYQEIKGAIDPRKISIKLDDFRETVSGQLDKFKDSLYDEFHLVITGTRWEQIKNTFLDSIEIDQKISLLNSKGFCIGEFIHNGCKIIEATENAISVKIDFDKTKADMCSLVINPDVNTWSHWVANKKSLCFEASSSKSFECILELQLPSAPRNYTIPFEVKKKNKDFKIKLNTINTNLKNWKNVKEVNFLVTRDKVSTCILKIRNLRIE